MYMPRSGAHAGAPLICLDHRGPQGSSQSHKDVPKLTKDLPRATKHSSRTLQNRTAQRKLIKGRGRPTKKAPKDPPRGTKDSTKDTKCVLKAIKDFLRTLQEQAKKHIATVTISPQNNRSQEGGVINAQ